MRRNHSSILLFGWFFTGLLVNLFQVTPVDGQASPYVFEVDERERFISPDGLVEVELIVNAQTVEPSGGSVGRLSAAPGAIMPEHTHDQQAEVLYLISGGGTVTVGGERVELSPGQVVYIPPGVPHAYVNDREVPLEVVQIYLPGGPEARFRSWTRLATTGTDLSSDCACPHDEVPIGSTCWCDEDGQVLRSQRGNAVWEYAYDDSGNRIRVEVDQDGDSQIDRRDTFQYDQGGNALRVERDRGADGSIEESWEYTYDDRGYRLTVVHENHLDATVTEWIYQEPCPPPFEETCEIRRAP